MTKFEDELYPVENLNSRLEKIEKLANGYTQQQQVENFRRMVAQAHKEHAAKNPSFDKKLELVRQKEFENLKRYYPSATTEQLAEEIGRRELMTIHQYASQGANPFAAFEDLADRYGYQDSPDSTNEMGSSHLSREKQARGAPKYEREPRSEHETVDKSGSNLGDIINKARSDRGFKPLYSDDDAEERFGQKPSQKSSEEPTDYYPGKRAGWSGEKEQAYENTYKHGNPSRSGNSWKEEKANSLFMGLSE